jgi:hypothetical protein
MKIHSLRPCFLFAAASFGALSIISGVLAEPQKDKTMQPRQSDNLIEILTLDIKAGRRDEFHNVYVASRCRF